jgi:Transglutaminase-like superfamily
VKHLSKNYRILLLFLLCSCFSVTLADQNYTTKDASVYRVRYLVAIYNANQPALDYSLKFPLFSTQNLPPYQKLVTFQVKSPEVQLIKATNGLTAQLTIHRLKPGQNVLAEFLYRFENSTINYKLPSIVGSDEVDVDSGDLKAEADVESSSSQVTSLAGKITAGAVTQLDKAKKLFDYVNLNLQYTQQSGDSHSALQTLRRGWGTCEDYSLLYMALCRAVGIPARYVSGYRFSPSEIGHREVELDAFAHAWVEINLPGTGWITVDPTYTYTVNGVKKVNYDFFGRILDDDRHLFFSYSRQQERTVTWNYESTHPARVATDFHIFIRKE